MAWWDVFFEILKIAVPAIIVFLTAYFVLKQFLQSQYQIQVLALRKERQHQILPLKLQAYERLSLYCERISPESLIFRLRTPGMTPEQLRYALLVAIHKEYEHNLSQQIYISENLWEIIRLAKNEILSIITAVNSGPDTDKFSEKLLEIASERKDLAINKALIAIKKEAALYLS